MWELTQSFDALGVLDDPEHCLTIWYLLSEEWLNLDDEKEFEIVDGNDRLIILSQHNHELYHHYFVISNVLPNGEKVTSEVK